MPNLACTYAAGAAQTVVCHVRQPSPRLRGEEFGRETSPSGRYAARRRDGLPARRLDQKRVVTPVRSTAPVLTDRSAVWVVSGRVILKLRV